MILTLDEQVLSVTDLKNKHTKVCKVFPREELSQRFNLNFPEEITAISYEPDRNLYHVVLNHDEVQVYSQPIENQYLQALHLRRNQIVREAIEAQLQYHEYDPIEDKYFIPEATQALIDKGKRQVDRLNILKQATIDQFEMLMALFQVGRDKGCWTAQDFPAPLRQKVTEWRTLINEFYAEDAS